MTDTTNSAPPSVDDINNEPRPEESSVNTVTIAQGCCGHWSVEIQQVNTDAEMFHVCTVFSPSVQFEFELFDLEVVNMVAELYTTKRNAEEPIGFVMGIIGSLEVNLDADMYYDHGFTITAQDEDFVLFTVFCNSDLVDCFKEVQAELEELEEGSDDVAESD